MSALSKFTIYNLQCTIKLILLLFTFYILHFTFYITPASAQSPSTPSSLPSPIPLGAAASSAYTLYPKSDSSQALLIPSSISPTSPIYTDLLVNNLFHSFSCLAVGSSIIGQPCLTYQLQKDALGAIKSVPVLSQTNLSGGALGATTSLIGLLYINPPVRTADYLASISGNFRVVKEARAQVGGSGAAVLSPILSLWQVSRNISYVVMIIIFVIIGLMVMFRQRINPQTVITAQAALPGLVIGLIMITFSFFFAGLISDMAFVGTNVVGYYFGAARGDTSQNLLEDMSDQNANVLSIYSKYTGIINKDNAASAVGNIWTQLDEWVQFNLRMIGSAVAAQFALPFGSLGGGPGQLIAGTVAAFIVNLVPEGIVGWVLSLMAMVILIYTMLRLFIRLINAYLNIIFLTITAPFQFLAASLPGRQGIATAWILNMLSHVLAFPAILAVLYFVAFILGKPSGPLKISDSGTMLANGLIPIVSAQSPVINVVGVNTFPLFGGMDLEFVRILLAFGALVAMPAIPDIIARTIGRVGVAGQLLGEEYGKGVGGGRGYFNQASGIGPGFAREVGNLREQPGYLYDKDKGWQKITSSVAEREGLTSEKIYQSGLRPGQAGRIKAAIKSWFK